MFDHPAYAATAGIDLGGTKLLIRYRERWLRQDTGPGFGAAQLTDVLRRFLDGQAEPPAALGIALAGLVNLLNPHRLSVGGGALRLAGYWPAAAQALRQGALPALLAACELRLVHEVEDLVALGAAQLARQRLRAA